MDPDFEELSHDKSIVQRLKQFSKNIDDIDAMTKHLADPEFYDTLSAEDKIKYNLLMSFNLNSLFWMYLRSEGVDPLSHQIKSENDRLREAMRRAQEIKDKKNMPRIDQQAAKRFVRNGLWTANGNNDEENQENAKEEEWDVVTVPGNDSVTEKPLEQ